MEENRNSKSLEFDQVKCERCDQFTDKPSAKINGEWLCENCRWNDYAMTWSSGVYPDILEEDDEADLYYYRLKKLSEINKED